MKKKSPMKKTILCALSTLALHAGAATLSYETVSPTKNIATGSNRTPESDKFVNLGTTLSGGQTFTSGSAYSTITEVWFEVGQDLGAAVADSKTVELMFWKNTGPDSWIGLPDSSTTPTLSATTYATSLGAVVYPEAADITAGTWLKFTLDASDQAAVGTLDSGGEYGFTLYASDLSLNLARHTDTSSSGYNIGAVISVTGSIDPKVAGSRDCNFFIIHAPDPANTNAISYEMVVPTTDVLAYENANHQNTYGLDGANFGGQTFAATNTYSAITELWFQAATSATLDGSATLSVTFWNNSNEAGNDWSLDAILPAADSAFLNFYPLPAGNLTAFNTWIRITFNASDQAAIGTLTAGQQVGFSISLGDDGALFSIARSGSTTGVPASYAGGAGFADSGLDGNTGTRDANFFIVGTIQGLEPDAPRSTHDVYGVNEGNVLTVSAPGVLANDGDPNGEPLAAYLTTAPVNGELTLNTNGSFTYTPNENFSGEDRFTYTAYNGLLYGVAATSSITVTNLPDAPTAVADAYLATTNRTLSIPAPGVLRNDTDPDGESMSTIKVSDPMHGILTLNPDGSFTYIPDSSYAGTDSFEYRISDGVLESAIVTVSLNVASQPNFIIIYADDMGFGDAGFNGYTDIHTPRLDAFTTDGVRFTQGYACDSVCGPSRAGLMTGVYPARMGILNNPAANSGIPISQPLISEMLKPAGYQTAVYGKWHIGDEAGLVRPLDRGFDHFFGFLDGGHDYYESDIDDPVWEDDQMVNLADYGYLTDAISDHAVNFIKENTNKPFFLYVAYNAVHFPWQVPSNYIDRVNAATTTIPENWEYRQLFAGMVLAMDDGVGRIMDTLEANGLSTNTLVFFISDNGTPEGQNHDINTGDHMSSTGGFRGWKGDSYEGGIRVPFAMNWKGRIPAGLVFNHPVINLDATATIFSLAQAGSPQAHQYEIPAGMESRFPHPTFDLDGVNLMPYLTGQNPARPHRKLYFRHNNKHAVIVDNLKLTWNDRTLEDGGDAIIEVDRVFDLSVDPFETNDLAPGNPELTGRLKNTFMMWDCALDPVVWGSDPNNRVCMIPSSGYENWIGGHTTETLNSIAGAYGDVNGDGEINYVGYAFDGPPLAVVPGAAFEVQTAMRHDDATISYVVQISPDIQTWKTITLTYSGGSWTSSDSTKILQAAYTDNGNGTGRLTLQTGSAYSAEQKLFVRVGVEM